MIIQQSLKRHALQLGCVAMLFAAMVPICFADSLSPVAGAPTTRPASMLTPTGALAANDFWAKSADLSAEHPADALSVEELEQLAEASNPIPVRIRAYKLLCDRAGHGKISPDVRKEDAAGAVAKAFAWLEAHHADAEVAKFSPQSGFTHYTVSHRSGDADGIWILIETVSLPPGFSGGLNIRFDLKSKTVTSCDRWGEVRGAR
jgi:hypothetical protein